MRFWMCLVVIVIGTWDSKLRWRTTTSDNTVTLRVLGEFGREVSGCESPSIWVHTGQSLRSQGWLCWASQEAISRTWTHRSRMKNYGFLRTVNEICLLLCTSSLQTGHRSSFIALSPHFHIWIGLQQSTRLLSYECARYYDNMEHIQVLVVFSQKLTPRPRPRMMIQ
jgi:hypothetical protein